MAKRRCNPVWVRGGFTLLELMVVISIISLLTTIMTPSLRRAKEQARQAVCMSNIRQFAIAWQMYSQDNSDQLCSPNTWLNYENPWGSGGSNPRNGFNNWVSDGPGVGFNPICNTDRALEDGVLWPYIESVELYQCESDRRQVVRSYAMSHAMGCPENFDAERNVYAITNIISPSERLVFVDAKAGSKRLEDGTVRGLGCFYPVDTYSNEWISLYDTEKITARHLGECNIVKGDLSVERFKWRDQRTIDFANGLISFAQLRAGSSDNVDIIRLKKLMKGINFRQR